MKMKALLTTAFGLILGLSLIAGCGGSAIPSGFVTPPPFSPPPHSPTPTPSATHIYIWDSANNGTIYAYALPITTTSIPVASIADGGSQNAMAFDATHRLFVTQNKNVQVFTPPIADGATSAFILTTTEGALHDVKVDSAGDVFVAGTEFTGGRCGYIPCNLIAGIDVFTAPVTSSSTVTFHIGVGSKVPFVPFAFDPVGMALDGSGNLWAGTNATMFKYAPPFSGTSVPALQFPIGFNPGDLAFDSAGNMYAAGNGVVVYRPPFTASTTKAFTISTPGDAANYLAFDAAGKLYVTTASGKLLVFSPPFSPSSAPAVTLALPGNSAMGVAIGP